MDSAVRAVERECLWEAVEWVQRRAVGDATFGSDLSFTAGESTQLNISFSALPSPILKMSDDEEVMMELEKLRRENEALRRFYAKTQAAVTSLSALLGTAGVGVSSGGLGSLGSSNVMVSFNGLEEDAEMIVQSFTAINKTAVGTEGINTTMSNTAPVNTSVMNTTVGGSKV